MPYRDHGYWYYRRYETGDEYPVYARRAATSIEASEQVLLDLREQSRGFDFYELGALEVSHDNRLLAYTDDTVGRRQHTLRFKLLETGDVLPDAVPNVEEAMRLAILVEHGFRHSFIMHSTNIGNLSRMAQACNANIFVKNGPSYAGLGYDGEGYNSLTIAGTTGEGLTSARSFVRPRRCVLVDSFRIV